MSRSNRVIFSDNGTLTDLTVELNNPHQGASVIPYTVSQDALYLGSELPFNHRYFEVSVANAVTSAVSVEIWTGTEWVAAVDVIDETRDSNGKSLAQSGIISFTPDEDETWGREDDTADIADLSSLRIYNLYWVRLKWNATLTSTLALSYVGQKFSNDYDLEAQYPDLGRADMREAFQPGKEDWTLQSIEAAQYIIRDLIRSGALESRDQIMDTEIFRMASVHKTAEIIYRAFGKGNEEEIAATRSAYKESLDLKAFRADKNENARLDPVERKNRSGWMTR